MRAGRWTRAIARFVAEAHGQDLAFADRSHSSLDGADWQPQHGEHGEGGHGEGDTAEATSHRHESDSTERVFLGALYGDWLALNAYRVVAAAPEWECSPYYSMRTLVCCMRPQRGEEDWLDRVDGRLTPDQFAFLAFEAALVGLSILAALRRYLTLLRDGRGREAAALIGAPADVEGADGLPEPFR